MVCYLFLEHTEKPVE